MIIIFFAFIESVSLKYIITINKTYKKAPNVSCVVKVVEIICGIKTKYIKILCEGKIKSKSAKKAEKIFITGIVIVGYGTTVL